MKVYQVILSATLVFSSPDSWAGKTMGGQATVTLEQIELEEEKQRVVDALEALGFKYLGTNIVHVGAVWEDGWPDGTLISDAYTQVGHGVFFNQAHSRATPTTRN